MEEDNLQQVIESCIRCGNNISGRSLNHLSSSIRRWIERSPSELISIIQSTLIEYDSQIVPTRILLSISNDLQAVEVQYFQELIHSVISKSTNTIITYSIISLIHNAVFILPVDSLSETEATQLANNIIDLLPNYIHQNDSLQNIATALSQFMKKWANSLTNPETLVSSLFTLLSNKCFTYATLSLLCQSVVYLILSNKILGDVNLKELIEDLTHHNPTVLDQCTSVSNVNFLDFAQHTLPLSTQFQLIGTLIFSLSPEKLSQVANRFNLLNNFIKTPPTDEISRTCFYHMLSAVLKATSKQITPKALNMCCNALLKNPETLDHANRHAIKVCFGYLLQCSSHTQNPSKFNEMLFQRILALSPKSILKQDALPLIIPCVPFSSITVDFFQYLLSLFDKQNSLALKCITEIYKKFDVPLDYSALLFKKLDQMHPSIRTSSLNNLLKADTRVISQIRNHALNCKEIDENRRLTLLLSASSFETKIGEKPAVSFEILESAIHSWDFEVRMSAIQLLCSQFEISDDDRLSILKETMPRVFVYCDLKFSKQLERCLDNIVRSLGNSNKANCETFIRLLMSEIEPLLKPYQSGVKKSYIICLIKTIWRTKPLYLLTKKLVKQLILGLFESSYALRDQFFQLLLLIVRTTLSMNNEQAKSIVKTVISNDCEFVGDLIVKNKDSPRFRESDGAARLIALIDIVQKEKPLDVYISEMWIEYLNGNNDSIPSHFPLSVILHILKSNIQDVKVRFLIDKLLPNIVQLISDSLAFMSVEANVEVIPIQQIRNDPPESQLHSSVNKSWLAVRQSLNIITCIINHNFEEMSKDLVENIGDTLFRFLVESRHFSTVYYAHLTFQSLCTRCYIRRDTEKLPEKWTNFLLNTADSFSSADHKASDGFVQTATALIHSEPSHLFGSQRLIYHLLLQFCYSSLDKPGTENQLRSALLLTEAIAKDNPTQVNIEPYEAHLLMSVFMLYTVQMSYEMRCTANHCLTALLLKHSERIKKTDTKDLDNVASRELFQSVNGIYDFFVDHLSVDQSDVAYVILQIILIMKPFPQETLFNKIAELKACKYSHVRRAAARAILVVIPPNLVDTFAQKCLNEIVKRASLPTLKSDEQNQTQEQKESQNNSQTKNKEDEKNVTSSSASSASLTSSSSKNVDPEITNNIDDDDDNDEQTVEEDDSKDTFERVTNTIDGNLLQIEQLCREFPSIKQLLLAQVEDICNASIKNHITDYIQIYAVISLAREFNCLHHLKPMLLSLFRKRKELHLMERPLGHQILRATFSVISDTEKAEVLSTNDFGTIFHLIIHIQSEKEEISPLIRPLLVDLYLKDMNQPISDYLPSLLSSPTEQQKEKYLQIIYSSQTGKVDDARFESMLNLAPLFVNNAKEVLDHFSQYSKFVDRSDSNILLSISKMMLHFHDQLFSSLDLENDILTHWKIALRILSDDNPSVRFPCCKALSLHLVLHLPPRQQKQPQQQPQYNGGDVHIDLCEFDLIEQIYRLIGKKKSALEEVLQELKEFKEDEGDAHFKKEPTPFLLPPSFHVHLIKQILGKIKPGKNDDSEDFTEEDDSDDKEKQREEEKKNNV